jgi:hypothetical protein
MTIERYEPQGVHVRPLPKVGSNAIVPRPKNLKDMKDMPLPIHNNLGREKCNAI